MPVSFKSKMSLREAQLLAFDLEGLFVRSGLRGQFAVCGSVRRQRPEVGDIDLVVDGDLSRLCESCWWRWVEGGEKKATLEFRGRQVNILRSDPEHWGAAVLYFTGPHGYNIGMRRRAKEMGYRLNERGLWDGDRCLASRTEEDIYWALGKEWKFPDKRGE